MLIHVSPRLYTRDLDPALCELVDWICPELGLNLVGGVDVVARRPFPNKQFLVACRKLGNLAVDGLMIETAEHVEAFTTTTRWRIVPSDTVVTHVVNYTVLDKEMDAITDDMVLWHNFPESMGGWRNRVPKHARSWTSASARPRMEITTAARDGYYADTIHMRQGSGPVRIEQRTEKFAMHTVERDRLLMMRKYQFWERLPLPEQAYQVARPACS